MAIVVDDSMSMRADSGGRSRFERARDGAFELLSSARDGDAAAVVLAGRPARVALAGTTDLSAARQAIAALSVSDRGTDLEGALALGGDLVAALPQTDRRIVVLSDLADGRADGPPLQSTRIPLWVALPELQGDVSDCAILRADRRGFRVHVALACGPGKSAGGRDVVVDDAAGRPLASAPAPPGSMGEIDLLLAGGDARPDRARLSGSDAISVDDRAPVVPDVSRSAIAVVVDSADESVATGGAPVVEQALAALKLDIDAIPIPVLPERTEDLTNDLGVILDDPPGLTPEQRHALGAFIDRGGVVLLALGPRAAAAPLGATLEPILTRGISWSENRALGAAPESALGALAASAESLLELGASRRAVLSPEDVHSFDAMLAWTDGAPLVLRRSIGRGEVWVVTLPLSADASDLPLRPAFLELLDEWVLLAKEKAAPQRSEVGTTWRFPGAAHVVAVGPAGRVQAVREGGGLSLVPHLVGAYRITVDGRAEDRVASPVPLEADLRPRPVVETQPVGARSGGRQAPVDASSSIALVLLFLMAFEMILRIVLPRAARVI
jgi:hypothetical protein